MNTFEKLFRVALVACVALVGMIMATILIVSTAIAFAVVYIVAKVRGKPLTAATYWNAMSRGKFGLRKAAPPSAGPASPAPGAAAPFARRPKRADIIDVEVRDLP